MSNRHLIYPYNPSVLEADRYIIKTSKAVSSGQLVEITNINRDGELSDEQIIAELKKVDSEFYTDTASYVKIFKEGIDFGLSQTGVRLLMYIISVLKPKQDDIKLLKHEVMGVCGWTSRANYYNAINCLLDNEYLFRKQGGISEYYINVCKIYNGERVTMQKRYKKDLILKQGAINKTRELYNNRKK